MNQPWKVIVVLAGIFLAGGVTGGFVTARVCKTKLVNRPVPEEWAPRTLRRYQERLGLSSEEHERIKPIVRRHMEELNRIRNRSMAETQVVVEAMQREISEKLTPEQRLKYEQLNRELREAREAREKAEREKRQKAERDLPEKPAGENPARK